MYIELHARSAFSFLEGSSIPEELAATCKDRNMPAMAVLDRDGVYGAPRFYHAAKKKNIRAHIGAEITSPAGWRYPLLVESREGYQNLCRAITRMKLRAKKGEGDLAAHELADYTSGLVCLTGGAEGPLAHALETGGIEQATRTVQQLCELFGRYNVYVELQRHFCRDEEARNQAAIEIARKLSLPLLATNGVSHALPHERELLDVFTCIRHHRNLATAGRLLTRNPECHLKSPEEMVQLFADLPEAIANTQTLSSRLEFSLLDLGYVFPKYPVPDGGSQMDFLRARAHDGLIHRYGSNNEKARRQIERELTLIDKLDLPGYFLIVWDIVRFCNAKNILVQGRGSAANSAVCYALGITAVDPVGMGLLFERFLSEERGEWPDIDLDLPSGDQRERAIQYVYERYGKLGAAMTANVITYRGKSAAREIGKALSFDPETLARLASLVSAWEYKDSNDTLENHFRDAGFDLKHPKIRKFFELCVQAQDLPRHLGQHSGGLVVCQGQLDSVVPLEPATMPNRVVVQWDKEDCADMGIVKVDLLGLGMMAVLEESLQIISKHYGDEVDLGHLPQNDNKVYKTLQKADTVGMFQIESRAQMACLPRLKPKEFYDIVVQVAIIRPGPIVGKMVHPYLKRRQGREAPECLHPSLKPVLERTLGVPLFQEQLLRMAMIASGFTGGEAEELRRAFGFKRSEKLMSEVEVKLRRGMERNGITGKTQDTIVQSITSFALYGFPESHAASFALIAYASAYLKCHYLAAFTAAMLNHQPMGFYNPATLVKDAQRHGLRIRPIDLTQSDWICTLEKIGEEQVLRIGLRYVKGLREEIGREIVRQREIKMFRSIDDLKFRVPRIQKSDLTALAEIGALNLVGGKQGFHRRDALWQIERVARRPGPLLESCEEQQELLLDEDAADDSTHSPLQQMTAEDRLVADFHNTGMTVGPHPLSYHREQLRKEGVLTAADLQRLCDGAPVRVAGSVIARQRPGTAKGFVFLSLEDETGISNAIITPPIFQQNHVVVVHQQFLLIEGRLQNQDNVISVKVDRVRPLFLTKAETVSHDFH
ncbi:MAG TPA: error-prone DNA polymerase [Candidatus Acidoferrum sp.]